MNHTETTTSTTPTRPKAPSTTQLVFPHGVSNLTIRVDPSMEGVYRGQFYGPKPEVTETEGTIAIDYPRFNPLSWGRTAADITVSPLVAWFIEIRDGAARWDSDLRGLELAGIEVRGGLSQADLQLPRPVGGVRITVTGGVSHLTVRRPADVPARLHIGGGASKLALDDQALGAVGGPVQLESSGYSAASDRYDVNIGGGASKITIARE